ncbi:uncharacterized protein A4U43_UnF3700 [Asparagus officinalis]|uniref:Uncharacterized protein n=1 Tax=Asparagus officinalis TaxID=4686 RepID=A0A1R3L722_ASPOF|nr:uncharacterized acetyltransferase At3g50280-like [Asparagus officinalis]ONK55412.1 uncharacterized protein A4U43_UnF3700 [Asparagus officinalis]
MVTNIKSLAMASPSKVAHQISTAIVKPSPLPKVEGTERCNLTPWDLTMISLNYIETGLLFTNPPPSNTMDQVADCLKASLSAVLFHFYLLAGRLVTEKDDDGLTVSIEYCNNKGGAEFIRAVADNITVRDVLAINADVPSFIPSLFPYYGTVNYDGHSLPLLALQVTELADGVFIACSMNHAIADGSSFWHFFQSWAEISRKTLRSEFDQDFTVTHPPITERFFINNISPPIKLPFNNPDQFIYKYKPPSNLRTRSFHFSSNSIAQLKSTANDQPETTSSISSFQALCSLLWRSITRARTLQPDETTTFRLTSDARLKLRPPLSAEYFGNFVTKICVTTTAGDLLKNDIGWAAQLLNQGVAAHDDKEIRSTTAKWMEEPVILNPSKLSMSNVSMNSSPRFGVYECDFGWGKPVGLRNGSTFKANGVVWSWRFIS